MSIAAKCPKCQATFNLPDDLAGKKVKCQKCAAIFTVSAKPVTKAKTSRDTAFAAAGPKGTTKIDKSDNGPPAKSAKKNTTLGKSTPKKAPAKPKAKSGGGVMIFLILFFVGGGLFTCCGGIGVGGWFFMNSETVQKKGDPIAFADKKDVDIKINDKKLDGGKKDDIKKDNIKKDDIKKDDGFKDKDGPPPIDGKKDGPPPLDGKKDGPPPIDGKKDGPPPLDGKKDGPPPLDGGNKDGLPKDPKFPPVPPSRIVNFQGDGLYRSSSSLSPFDPLNQENKRHKLYQMSVEAGRTYQIDMSSTAFDSFLFLVDETGKIIARDDDGGGNLDARITHKATRNETLRIQASVLGVIVGKSLKYTLTVQRTGDVVVGNPPDPAKGDISSKTFALNPGAKLAYGLVWARDAKSYYLITETGLLQRISADTGMVEKQRDFERRCGNLSPSGEGLLISVLDAQEVWIIDPDNFDNVKKKIAVPAVGRVSAGVDSKLAVAGNGRASRGGGIRLINLEKGMVVQEYPKFENHHLIMSPDGNYVFCQGGGEELNSYRVVGETLEKDGTSPRIAANGQNVCVSPDGSYVCLPAGGGNGNDHPDHPPVGNGYTTYAYPVNNLKRPAFAITSGAYPQAVGFDPKFAWVYAQNANHNLMLFTYTGIQKAQYSFPGVDRLGIREFSVSPLGGEVLVGAEARVVHVKVHIKGGEPIAKIELPKIDPKIDPKVDPKEDPKKDPPKVATRPLEKDDVTHRVIKFAETPLRNPVWTADGKSFIVLQQNGKLQRILAETGAVDKEHALVALAGTEAALGMSAEGLVVSLPREKQVWVVDPDDFTMVKKRISVPGVFRLASSPDSKTAVAAVTSPKAGLRALDLVTGEAGPAIAFKTATLNMKMSPDGKFLFFSDNGRIMRYRFDGVNVVYEETTPYGVVTTPASLHISPDSQYVSLAGSIAAPPPDRPGRELFAFSTTTLKKPALAMPKLDFPRAIAVDTTANWVYTNDTKRPLIIYNFAGIKQWEFPLADIDASSSYEFIVSPMGQEFVIRTNSSLIHVKVAISGGAVKVVKEDVPKVNPKNEKLVSIVVNTTKNAGFVVEDLNMKAKLFAGNWSLPCWDAQGRNLYWLQEDKIHRLTRDMRIEASAALGVNCDQLALSSGGLLTIPQIAATEVWLIDPTTLAVRNKIPTTGMRQLIATPSTPTALGNRGSELVLLDTRVGKQFKTTYAKPLPGGNSFSGIAMSPDGRFVWVQETNNLLRFRINGTQLVLEGSRVEALQTRAHAQFSPDSRLVGITFDFNKKIRNTDVFSIDNWNVPAYTFPERFNAVAFDSRGGLWVTKNAGLRYYPNPAKAPQQFSEIPLNFTPSRLVAPPVGLGCLAFGAANSAWVEPAAKN